MYTTNLTEDLRLRLSSDDMDFLRELSEKRACSISEVIRSVIADYRRSVQTLDMLSKAINISIQGGKLSNGDTETNIDHLL